MLKDTLVANPLDNSEADAAKDVYVGSDEQPLIYETVPVYAEILSDLIASMQPRTILEFGCNAGRNLNLLRSKAPEAVLTGVDVNPKAAEQAKNLHGLDVTIADEGWIQRQATDAFDVSFTVSVIDHMPYPETVLRELLRITKHYLVLFELAHDRIGRTTHNLFVDGDQARLVPAYRYSYTHDYRHECERKFGAQCLMDAKFPIGESNLLDLYRLYVFSKSKDLCAKSVLSSVRFEPIDGSR